MERAPPESTWARKVKLVLPLARVRVGMWKTTVGAPLSSTWMAGKDADSLT